MSKKSVAMIVVGVAVVFFILGASFFQSDNESSKEVSESENEREINDFLSFNEEDLKTKKEIADIIDQYKSENEEITEGEIADKLAEEYGETVGYMYLTGLMIDDDFSDEDNRQILALLDDDKAPYKKTMPVKKIRNPINREFGNKEENRLIRASDMHMNSFNYDKKSYVKDTEGFYDVEGFNIGYPAVNTEYRVEEGEIVVDVLIMLYMDEIILREDVEDYFDKYKNVEINGKTLEDDRNLYAMKDEMMKDLDDDDYVFLDNTVHTVVIEMELNELFEHDFETFEAKDTNSLTEEDMEKAEEEMNKAFGLGKESIEESPVITINGETINIDDYIITRGIEGSDEDEYENDFSINPEVIGSM